MIKWLTIVLSVLGLGLGTYTVATEKEQALNLPLAREASVNPFTKGVAALGIIEPAGRNVGIVPPEPALVTEVLVGVGDRVEAGQALFRLDSRTLQAQLIRAEAGVRQSEAEVARWHGLPRVEDIPPLEAAVARAEAIVKDRQEVLALTEQTVEKGSGNARDISAAQYALESARADLARARAELAKLRAGGWKPDLEVATAGVEAQRAEVASLKLLMDRLTVRAPRAGTVLRRDIEPGEYSTTSHPAMIIGDLTRLAVRAQVDEEDIALVSPKGKAVARSRGGVVEEIPLVFVRIEPYARPKTDLLGTNAERVDTRVVDVVYEFQTPPRTNLFPGEAVDDYIDAGEGAPPRK